MLWRVAVLMAVIICRVTQISAKAWKEASLSGRKSRNALNSPIMPSCTMSSWSAPTRKYERALDRTKFLYLLSRYSDASAFPLRKGDFIGHAVKVVVHGFLPAHSLPLAHALKNLALMGRQTGEDVAARNLSSRMRTRPVCRGLRNFDQNSLRRCAPRRARASPSVRPRRWSPREPAAISAASQAASNVIRAGVGEDDPPRRRIIARARGAVGIVAVKTTITSSPE